MLSKKQISVVSNNRILGRVPAAIARELVKTNHANIVNKKPVVIGLTQTKVSTQKTTTKRRKHDT